MYRTSGVRGHQGDGAGLVGGLHEIADAEEEAEESARPRHRCAGAGDRPFAGHVLQG